MITLSNHEMNFVYNCVLHFRIIIDRISLYWIHKMKRIVKIMEMVKIVLSLSRLMP